MRTIWDKETGAKKSVLAPIFRFYVPAALTPGRRPCLHMFRFSEPQGIEEKIFTLVAI